MIERRLQCPQSVRVWLDEGFPIVFDSLLSLLVLGSRLQVRILIPHLPMIDHRSNTARIAGITASISCPTPTSRQGDEWAMSIALVGGRFGGCFHHLWIWFQLATGQSVFEGMVLEILYNEAKLYITSLTRVQLLREEIRSDWNNKVHYI